MGVSSRYWQIVKIDAAGRRQVREITPAKEFLADVFPQIRANNQDNGVDVPDTSVQSVLLPLSRNTHADKYFLAERCLLCFISWEIEQVCLQLTAAFGTDHGFSVHDLFPHVLDDDGKLKPVDNYQCVSRQVLESWNPEKSSLTTWTNIRVKQYHILNQFLLERGVYLVSDWAILNDTKNQQLQRILTEFYSFAPSQILLAQQLLECYHAIYRQDRLQQRALGRRGKCTIPTTQQLEQIASLFRGKTGKGFSSEMVMSQLQEIAAQLRRYRIHVRGGPLPAESMDVSDRQLEDIKDHQNEEVEFLELYQSQFLACLEKALAVVTQSRVNILEKKKGEQAKKFLLGLQLFHCQNLSMTEIASKLGLRAQDAVTRLLKLKDFRTDVRRELLSMLGDRILELAKSYAHPDKLYTLEQQIKIVLDEQIDQIIKEAEIQAQTAKINPQPTSLFNQKLCHYLDGINKNI